MKNPRILVSGYYGFGNAGDEAILYAMSVALKKALPDVTITVMSENPERTRQMGVQAVQRKNLSAIVRELMRTSLFISGGGGLIQDSTGVSTIRYYLGLVMMAHWFRRPVMFFAQGVGPIATAAGRDLTRKVANTVQLITVRDEESRALLADVGVDRPPIHVTADPVLLHEPAPAERVQQILRSAGIPEGEPLLAVSVRPWPSPPTPIDALQAALSKVPGRIVLLPFQHSQDLEMCRELTKRLGSRAHLLEQELTTPELQGVVGAMRAVVAMRLHCLIFAATQYVPMFGLSYDPKVRQFMRLVEGPEVALADATAERLERELTTLWEKTEARRAELQRIVPRLRQKAEETVRHVCALLGR